MMLLNVCLVVNNVQKNGLALDRIHNNLKRFMGGDSGDASYSWDTTELANFLSIMVAQGRLDLHNGMYTLLK
jgi:Anaphase promoting complex (APC) subunit 2